jgi:hypothetical protein
MLKIIWDHMLICSVMANFQHVQHVRSPVVLENAQVQTINLPRAKSEGQRPLPLQCVNFH